MLYLDYNATTPVSEQVRSRMVEYLQSNMYGNPSSGHALGKQMKSCWNDSLQKMASLLGCDESEVTVTSGGSEAVNTALFGCAALKPKCHIVTSSIEHYVVLEICKRLESQGHTITYVDANRDGVISANAVESAMTKDTGIVSVMGANNETGVIQPIAEIAAIARSHGALMVVDGCQAVGKIPMPVRELGVDILCAAGHKMYCPSGIGMMFVRQGLSLPPFILGAQQQSGKRAGTEPVLMAVGLAEACSETSQWFAENGHINQGAVKAEIESHITDRLKALGLRGTIHGSKAQRLPNTISLAVEGVKASLLIAPLSDTIAFSTGAACHSCGSVKISHVLKSMSVQEDLAVGTFRISLSRTPNAQDVIQGVDILLNACKDQLKAI